MRHLYEHYNINDYSKTITLCLCVSAFGKKQNFLAKSIDFQNNYVYLQPASRLIPYWECEGGSYLHS